MKYRYFTLLTRAKKFNICEFPKLHEISNYEDPRINKMFSHPAFADLKPTYDIITQIGPQDFWKQKFFYVRSK
jgi:hypothetical protein